MAIPSIAAYPLNSLEAQNRVDWSIDPDRAVLLVHDMQQYFLNFYAQDSELVKSLLSNIQEVKRACKAVNIPVVYTAQPGDQSAKDRALLTDFWGPGLIDDESITKIHPSLTPEDEDIVYTKWRYSAFQRTPLENMMKESGRDQLIIVGIYAHIGCLQTTCEAFMMDIQAFMISDATADFSQTDHQMALDYVAGRCGYVLDKEQLIAQLPNQNSNEKGSEYSSASPVYSIPKSEADLKAQIANLLSISVDELTMDDSLLDFGLDSIRMMSLVSSWQQSGLSVTFMDLATSPKVNEWWELIQHKTE